MFIRRKFNAARTSFCSARTLSRPRKLNYRNPMMCFIHPLGGLTIALRLRYAARTRPVARLLATVFRRDRCPAQIIWHGPPVDAQSQNGFACVHCQVTLLERPCAKRRILPSAPQNVDSLRHAGRGCMLVRAVKRTCWDDVHPSHRQRANERAALVAVHRTPLSVLFPYKQKRPANERCKPLISNVFLVGSGNFELQTPAV